MPMYTTLIMVIELDLQARMVLYDTNFKEKRKQEAREREEAARREEELAAMNAIKHEMEQSPPKSNAANGKLNHMGNESKKGGCLWTLWIFTVTVFFLFLGFGASLIWIYTGGHLDQRSIERALPIIQRDVDAKLAELSVKASQLLDQVRTKPDLKY